MIAAVVLAAGEGSRFGGAKQQLLLPDVLAAVRASSVEDLVVVAGAHPVDVDAQGRHLSRVGAGPGSVIALRPSGAHA